MLILGLAGSKVEMLGTPAVRASPAPSAGSRLAAPLHTEIHGAWNVKVGINSLLVEAGPGRGWVLMLLSNNRYVVCHTHCHTVTSPSSTFLQPRHILLVDHNIQSITK